MEGETMEWFGKGEDQEECFEICWIQSMMTSDLKISLFSGELEPLDPAPS